MSSESTPESPATTQPKLRVGLGFDTHRLEPGGPLRVGGIDIECPWQAVGHSDADVLIHAVVDALLGAANQGDIGRLFPDTDASNRDRDSADFLLEAKRQIAADGWQLVNLDGVILAQAPKMAPHIPVMSLRIAEILGVQSEQIGLKAKTGESVGPVGRHEAIQARVVCLLWRA